MAKFSVLVAVYNAAATLPRCLDSLRAQTLTDFEAICIDDASTDGSWAILSRYAAWKGLDVTGGKDLSAYRDAGDISPYARTSLAWANAAGLITGRDKTTLAPRGTATRAEAATILMRLSKLLPAA